MEVLNNRFYLCLSILFFSVICCGQKSTSVGVNLSQGISFAKVGNGDHNTFTNPAYTYFLGGYLALDMPKSNNFLSLNFNYSRRGYSFTIYNFFDEDKIKAKLRLHYLTTSISYNLDTKIAESLKLKKALIYLQLGSYISSKLDQKWVYNKEEIPIDNTVFNNLDWGILTGIGVFFDKTKNRPVYISLQMSIGLKNIIEPYRNTYKTYLRVLELVVSAPIYSF